jgi:hypothetical protein
MIKQQITYGGFDGQVFTEDFHFHLSTSELVTLNINHARISGGFDTEKSVVTGGYKEYLETELASGDGKRIMAVFRELIFLSYGERSEDGKRFRKGDNQELAKAFAETEAYDQLFIKLVTNADFGAEFFNGIMPSNISDEASKLAASQAARERSEAQMQGHRQAAPVQQPEPEVVYGANGRFVGENQGAAQPPQPFQAPPVPQYPVSPQQETPLSQIPNPSHRQEAPQPPYFQ